MVQWGTLMVWHICQWTLELAASLKFKDQDRCVCERLAEPWLCSREQRRKFCVQTEGMCGAEPTEIQKSSTRSSTVALLGAGGADSLPLEVLSTCRWPSSRSVP